MSASELPYEILSKIADLLLTGDRFSCVLTCRRWRYPFQEALWRNMHVNSMKNLETICNAIEGSRTKSSSYGLLTQSLRMDGYCTIPHWQQHAFFRSIPNLRHLDLGRTRYQEMNTHMIRLNNTWKSLESLRVEVHGSKRAVDTKSFVEFLKTCRKLQKLEIFQNAFDNPVMISSKDFNNLHQSLKQLSHLKACLYLNQIRQNAEPTIPITTPAPALISLDLDLFSWHPLWIYYFGYKYPNLRFLRLDVSNVPDCWIPQENLQRMPSLFLSNPNVLQHLETFEFLTTEMSQWSHIVFWEFLCPLQIPIKHLKYKTKYSKCDAEFLEMAIARFVKSFSNTLETLSVDGDVFFNAKYITKLSFTSCCPLLVDLEIKDCGVSIELDNLLDICVALRRLRFSNGKLWVDQDTTNQERNHENYQQKHRQHELQILVLHWVNASAGVFTHMSSRCRRLEYMSLGNSDIWGSISKETGNLLLDMSYTSFKALRLKNVQYHSSDRDTGKDTAINISLLPQLNNSRSPKEIMEEKGNKDSKLSIIEHYQHHLAWFHTFFDDDYEYATAPCIRQLSVQEVNTALEYYQDFLSRESTNALDVFRSLNGQVSEKDWEEDLCRGYAEFRCSHIEKYTIPGLTPDDEKFWENLYNKLF
ncbi:hypothetical protein F4703DRAFT_1793868 [Phycomyces blakesleeanus]